jgi:MFS family permease
MSLPGYRGVPTEEDQAVEVETRGLAADVNQIDETASDAVNNRDAQLLVACKCVRLFGFGFLSVMLALYLKELGFTEDSVGLLFTLTLLGDAVISLGITTHADVIGRRLMLLAGAALAVCTTLIFITQSNFWVLTFAAIFGVITPSGNEIGPFMAIELSSLSQVTPDTNRTKLMAWYTLAGCVASAVGALVCGATLQYCAENYPSDGPLFAHRVVLTMYLGTQVVLTAMFWCLSSAIEVPVVNAKVGALSNPVRLFMGLHKSQGIVLKLSLLFMLDAFAGSFVLQSLTSAWFDATYHTDPQRLGLLVFICNIVAGFSALFAVQLADLIGLVMTMVVTHLPSNILLILVPLMPSETLAIVFLCLRYSISQMDVPTRNAYVQGVVDADERSAANGITNVVRSVGASSGPYLAGLLYANPAYANYPWYIAGGLKIAYDLLLLYSMNHTKPPEEIARELQLTAVDRQQEKQAGDYEGELKRGENEDGKKSTVKV